ncbi:MAG TPA: pilin [Candidatus Saccharimonadales bacterium]
MKVVMNIVARIVCAGVLLGVLAAPLVTAPAAASAQSDICAGIAPAHGSCGTGTGTINQTLKNVVDLLSAIAGVIAVIMLIVGGIKYITSSGDASNISGAKNTIIFALVGLVVVALAQALVHFVLSRV